MIVPCFSAAVFCLGDIGLRRHRPSPAGRIILRPTEPWESFGVLVYNTIVQMGPSDYRMSASAHDR